MRVLLVDDHPLFRAGVASLLRARGLEVVGEANDGVQALELAQQLRPDLVLMDITMPTCDGLEATRLIKAHLPATRIVILTVSDEAVDLVEALSSGAEGYLLKNLTQDDLEGMLEGLEAGSPALTGRLTAKLVGELSSRRARSDEAPPASGLTRREQDVLALVAAGQTNREIGAALSISENTVNFHVRNILARLGVRNRAEAAAYATRTGLASQSPAGE
jgi:DNA-binding NarL/FixJ family response regulator